MANKKTETVKEKRRRGPAPMTPEQKEEAAKARALKKEQEKNLPPEIFIQYKDIETDMATIAEAAKADFHSHKKRTYVTNLKLYVKPEENMVYYVVNGEHKGSIPL